MKIAVMYDQIWNGSLRGTTQSARSLIAALHKNDEVELYALVSSKMHYGEGVYTAFKICKEDLSDSISSQHQGQLARIFAKVRIFAKNALAVYASPARILQEGGAIGGIFLDIMRSIFARTKESSPQVNVFVHIDEFDIVLNVWWFNCPSNSLVTLPPLRRAIVVSWFLDALPLSVPLPHHDKVPPAKYYAALRAHLSISQALFCISNDARQQLQSYFPCTRDKKVYVIPLAANSAPRTEEEVAELRGVRLRENQKQKKFTLLVVGITEPSKNTLNILRALLWIAQKHPSSDVQLQLTIIGTITSKKWRRRAYPLLQRVEEFFTVEYHASVTNDVRDALYRKADLLLYVSVREGFGIPPLEAASWGVPSLLSENTPFRDNLGEAGKYCSPLNPIDMGKKIYACAQMSPIELASLGEAYRKALSVYSWDSSALMLYSTLKEIITEPTAE